MMNVNWLAVIVGAVAAFGAGWLWYSDMMFGQKWREGIGVMPTDGSPMVQPCWLKLSAPFCWLG